MTTTIENIKKPKPLRIIFMLNALMMFLPFIFYYVFTTKDISIDGLDPIIMVYTGIAYIISFSVLVFSILKRKLLLFRLMFGVNILIALPASAYIGTLIAIVSMALSFTKKVETFFTAELK